LHGHVRRERAEQVHRRDLGASGVYARRAVGDGLAAEQHCAAIAQRPEPLQARLALAAGRDEREDHVVALGKAGDVLADLGDHARTLVAAERGKGDRGGTGGQVVVGVAHARRVHADLDLIGDGIAHVARRPGTAS
jgi:hypothetical protein